MFLYFERPIMEIYNLSLKMQVNSWLKHVYFSADSRIIESWCVCGSSFIYWLRFQ
jgi:hypothetical protein